jgi:hypothetical protein
MDCILGVENETELYPNNMNERKACLEVKETPHSLSEGRERASA